MSPDIGIFVLLRKAPNVRRLANGGTANLWQCGIWSLPAFPKDKQRIADLDLRRDRHERRDQGDAKAL